jgi:hypothetical protein
MGLNNRNIDTINVTVYSYIMTQREKLILRAMNNPADLSFDDLRTLLKHEGWVFDHQTGSHQIWYSTKGFRISIQNNHGKAKAYQVKQFLQQNEKEKKHD